MQRSLRSLHKCSQKTPVASLGMLLFVFGPWVGVASCTIDARPDSGDSDRSEAAERLSEDASKFFGLMRWDPFADGVRVPRIEDAVLIPATGDAADAAAVADAVAAIAGADLKALSLDPLTGRLRARANEFEVSPGPDLTQEAVLIDAIGLIVAAAGAAPDETELSVTTLRATGGEIGEEPTTHDVAKTVHVSRKVLGVNVALDFGYASFAMDGRFISLQLQWRRIDYAQSALVVEGVENEFDIMALAAESLSARGVNLRPSVEAIDVGTYYLARPPADPASDLWTLHLVGYAGLRDANGTGLGTEGSIPSYEFFVDGGGPLTPSDE